MKTLNVQRRVLPMDAILENPLSFEKLMNSPAFFDDQPTEPKCDYIVL